MASDITAGTLAGKNTKVHESLVDGIDSYEDTTPRKVISKKDLWICALRGLFMEGNFNFERMQAGGFAYSIIPALKKIHGDNKRDLAKSLKNHLQFFNASPKLFTFLLGTAIAMEENKEKPSTVNVMKVAGHGGANRWYRRCDRPHDPDATDVSTGCVDCNGRLYCRSVCLLLPVPGCSLCRVLRPDVHGLQSGYRRDGQHERCH